MCGSREGMDGSMNPRIGGVSVGVADGRPMVGIAVVGTRFSGGFWICARSRQAPSPLSLLENAGIVVPSLRDREEERRSPRAFRSGATSSEASDCFPITPLTGSLGRRRRSPRGARARTKRLPTSSEWSSGASSTPEILQLASIDTATRSAGETHSRRRSRPAHRGR